MSNPKIIAVFGATGAQGGGLARAILDDPDGGFAVRAITRDVDSEKAKVLAESGAEVVAADLDDETSLRRALDGAYGAYFVTFFWAHFSPEKEMAEAWNMAAAGQGAGLHHAIWSTLEDTRLWMPLDDARMPTLMEHYKVPHFDAKGESNHLFTEMGVPTTFLLTSFYWDNLIHFGMGPRRKSDGRLVFTLPMDDKKLPGIAAEDIGRCAYGIFKQGERYIGQTVGIAGEHLTGEQMAAALSDAFGEEVHYRSIRPEVYRSLGFPGADDLGNMFQFKRDFEADFCGARDPTVARALNPALKSFRKWLEINKDRIPRGG
ncbi:NmrA/HSCARG family protein [Thiocapsa bogorovii]|uniref:NmrA/HSCARG family protein n=1 Tax=Thiocapsa bogorovii TaxID=521689 RepID=UPI001E521AD2|nr:NmrA/HSCARG family protein [Thiocapsa bogorovii]UHD15864.1 NmrA/HSCARG family protein [Thiocapsa bogorovii]